MFSFASIDALDHSVSLYLFSVHTPTIDNLFSVLTLLGNKETITTLVLLTSGWLFYTHRPQLAYLTILASVGSSITTYLLKFVFARPRPELILNQLDSFSFPSGHATGAIALYGLLMYVTMKLVPGKNYRYSILIFLSLITVLVGFSRIYLGYHYLSDVMVGYGVGLVWLLFSIKLFKSKNY